MNANLQIAMNDSCLRDALKIWLRSNRPLTSRTMVIDELGLKHGAARIDVAVIGPGIHGYEIKSECDTLRRLPVQVAIYNSVLDKITVVLAKKHLKEALHIIPDWWGILVASDVNREAVSFTYLREPTVNPLIQPLAIAKLLWREEALSLLEELGATNGVSSKPRSHIYARLAEVAGIDFIRNKVCEQLRLRIDWRAA